MEEEKSEEKWEKNDCSDGGGDGVVNNECGRGAR